MHLIPTILNTMLILSTTKKMGMAIINLKGRKYLPRTLKLWLRPETSYPNLCPKWLQTPILSLPDILGTGMIF